LYNTLEDYFVNNNCEYIIAKTLNEISKYEPYGKTKKFYLKMGFKELLILIEIWDENNPCLIMIKNIR
jgi:hypothetical protein